MKVKISRAALVAIIGKIQGIVPSKPAIPILANILLQAEENQVSVAATDLTVGVRTQIEAHVEEVGAMTLPARRFFQLIRELTTPEIEIESSAGEEIVTIQAGSSHFRLHGMHKSEFPALPDLSQGAHFALETEKFKEMLSHSVFAAAKEDSRQVLNGVLMRLIGKEAIFVGTDGKRLAKLSTPVKIEEEQSHDYLIPLKAVEEIIKLLDEGKWTVIRLLPDKIEVECESASLVTRLLPGEYPDIDQIIPKEEGTSFHLHREELMTLLRQIALFTPDRGHSVQFTLKEGELLLSAHTSDIGEGKVSMPLDYSGEKIEMAFNPLFFHDILRHCRDETVSFTLTNPYNPGLITDSTNAQFVIMPMRLHTPVSP